MSSPSDDLRIPKIPVTVRLAIEGQGMASVKVFVAEHLADSMRRQRVLDLLESERLFFPALDQHSSPRIINKATVKWVEISLLDGALPVEEEVIDSTLYDVCRTVVVELVGGDELTGDLLYSPPPERARVVDYLNSGGRFLRLWNPERVLLVNKDRIISVREDEQAQEA
ncbi:MAG: hypothetical protein KJO07_19465 [Deltaproteobacteria bacterium]|jgi:hypothetical protein|nr:hypothetical protein [Deltaproteobacteria bacterium]